MYNLKDFVYNGKYHDYTWNVNNNPNATIENGLANCTTLTIAFTYINKLPYPVSRIVSAGNWHRVLINGWSSVPYGTINFKVGDIIQWTEHNHVATVIGFQEGEPILGCSWYTGEHGKSMYNGSYDPRHFKSLKELSDFMENNYPYRMYHECSVYEESQRVGGDPERVLVAPILKPVERNYDRDQIKVLTDEQYVRDENNNIIGVAQHGFYNVLSTKKTDYVWYEVEHNKFIAQVDGRVEYYPCDLRQENDELKRTIKEINELLRKWV